MKPSLSYQELVFIYDELTEAYNRTKVLWDHCTENRTRSETMVRLQIIQKLQEKLVDMMKIT